MSDAKRICPQCGTEYPPTERFCARDGTALRSPEAGTDLVGTVVADRYLIIQQLGEGGMGRVYLAEHVKMGRKSALKVLHPSLMKDISAVSRFNREAANASRISHPNVASIYDFGETTDGMVYLAMEYVEGPSLTALNASLGGATMPMARAAEIVRQTADALGAAHDMGIVHRDLKPDNIMISKAREGGDWVKVVDFGIAKAVGAGAEAQKVTKTGHVIGTPEYMSPEQLAGDNLDGRSDIYALGIVAFNLLTGALPFPSDSQQEAMIMRLTDKPQTLAAARPDVPWSMDLQSVMDKALERDVDARYRTAPEFGRDFARAIAKMPSSHTGRHPTPVTGTSHPIAPVPPTRVTVARKSRRPIVIAIAAAVVVVGAGLTAMKQMGSSKQTPTVPAANTAATDAPATQAAVPDSTVTQKLTALIDLANDPAHAQHVLSAVNAVAATAKSSEELFLVARLRSTVAAAAGDTTRACAALRAIRDSVARSEVERIDNRMKTVLFCK